MFFISLLKNAWNARLKVKHLRKIPMALNPNRLLINSVTTKLKKRRHTFHFLRRQKDSNVGLKYKMCFILKHVCLNFNMFN